MYNFLPLVTPRVALTTSPSSSAYRLDLLVIVLAAMDLAATLLIAIVLVASYSPLRRNAILYNFLPVVTPRVALTTLPSSSAYSLDLLSYSPPRT
jgi:hypothetical protein